VGSGKYCRLTFACHCVKGVGYKAGKSDTPQSYALRLRFFASERPVDSGAIGSSVGRSRLLWSFFLGHESFVDSIGVINTVPQIIKSIQQ
jgi:hypothetical protein